jgi:hypothetical protein
MADYVTRFGSLKDYEKGSLEIIADDPRRYVYSNMFEVAANSAPYEKVAVAKNIQYVLEVLRAEGTSEWRTASHDESALVMDGEVEIRLVKLDTPLAGPEIEGSIAVTGEPEGAVMGKVIARRGHMTLLPANAAYQFHAPDPSVILLQTIEGKDTVYKWGEICQTLP